MTKMWSSCGLCGVGVEAQGSACSQTLHAVWQHPFGLEELPMSVELRISPVPFVKSPLSSCTPMCDGH
ncbi:hypothetical protein DAPPUDRAFT_240730 [Daphnia pulex]|uniref:Uncharacterized protein n=1 Tax=Daphnia pulex TaxID=6669 RepID=E9GCD2_DAPPU|nr:hypothetical protein DAPPUDRAFT_240730 [Daphnia pulex]|eukprot:EFX82876.1 hypothetical protein DAPPUDRAFT_240730 [Daphnia pulex]